MPRQRPAPCLHRGPAQDVLVEGMGFELLHETEIPQLFGAPVAQNFPCQTTGGDCSTENLENKKKKNALCGDSELRPSWVSQPRTPNRLFISPLTLLMLQQSRPALEVTKTQFGTKGLSGVMEIVYILSVWLLRRCIHLSKLVKLYM